MTHTVMAIVSPVKRTAVEDLRALLDQIGDDPEGNAYVPFCSLRTLHFSSLVLHDAHQDKGFAPCLVFENNFDGALDLSFRISVVWPDPASTGSIAIAKTTS
jgi:hypothetical protein